MKTALLLLYAALIVAGASAIPAFLMPYPIFAKPLKGAKGGMLLLGSPQANALVQK